MARTRRSCDSGWKAKESRSQSKPYLRKGISAQISRSRLEHKPLQKQIKSLIMTRDSPLSIAASVIGILTFVAAMVGGFYVRTFSLKNTFQQSLSEHLKVAEIVATSIEEANRLAEGYIDVESMETRGSAILSGKLQSTKALLTNLFKTEIRLAVMLSQLNPNEDQSTISRMAKWSELRLKAMKHVKEQESLTYQIRQNLYDLQVMKLSMLVFSV